MTAAPTPPARSAYRDLLADLLQRPVTVEGGVPQQLGREQVTYLADYRDDDRSVAAVVVLDLALATAVAAALATAPPWQTRRRVEEEGQLDPELVECLGEVCNVCAQVFNGPDRPHVRFAGLTAVPGAVAADVAQVVGRPRARQDWSVAVRGYGGGSLAVLQ